MRKHTYAEIRFRWGLSAQAAQHAIKKTCDAYTTLKVNLRNGRYGRPGSRRHTRAAGKPVVLRPDAAQPYDDRKLSWQHQARTVSIWTTAGRLKNVAFAGQAEQLEVLAQHRRGESDLVCQGGKWFLIATCDIDEATLNTHPVGFVGVDLGIVDIAATSEGTKHSGRRINRKRENDRKQRAKLQKKDTKSAKRRAKNRAGKEARRAKDINHKVRPPTSPSSREFWTQSISSQPVMTQAASAVVHDRVVDGGRSTWSSTGAVRNQGVLSGRCRR